MCSRGRDVAEPTARRTKGPRCLAMATARVALLAQASAVAAAAAVAK